MTSTQALAFSLPPGIPPQLITAVGDAARNALARHGVVAFEASRDAAIAHEISHAIVGTHEGFKIRQIAIYSRADLLLGTVWGGRYREVGGWTSGPDTSANDDLRRARLVIAGLAGEAIAGLDKPGSSLDELALSQAIGCNAAAKLADPELSDAEYDAYAQNLWHERIWYGSLAILRVNREVFEQLAHRLNQDERVEGGKLKKVLGKIQRIAP